MDRDLVLFLDHAHQHVIDQIKIQHPEWVADDGVCKPCAEYYEREMAGGEAEANIGPAGRRWRAVAGGWMLAVSAGFAVYAAAVPLVRPLRSTLFLPLFLGIFALLESRKKTCSMLAEMGARNPDTGVVKIEDPAVAEKLRARGRAIVLQSALWAGGITALFFALPF